MGMPLPWQKHENARPYIQHSLREQFVHYFADDAPKARIIFYEYYKNIHIEYVSLLEGALSLLQAYKLMGIVVL